MIRVCHFLNKTESMTKTDRASCINDSFIKLVSSQVTLCLLVLLQHKFIKAVFMGMTGTE